jgi:hypothetical protein
LVLRQVQELAQLQKLYIYGLRCSQSVEALGEMVGGLQHLRELGLERCEVGRFEVAGFERKLPGNCQLVIREIDEPVDHRWGF